MAQVALSFNKRSYRFECADADADKLERVAGHVRDTIDALLREHGPIGDERLVLMAALTIADELFEARADIDELLEQETGKLRTFAETVKGMRPSVPLPTASPAAVPGPSAPGPSTAGANPDPLRKSGS